MQLRSSAIAAVILLDLVRAVPAQAQVTFELINEYPATSISGEADAFFVTEVDRRTAGLVKINPILDAKSGLRSRDHLAAVTEGRFAIADSFGGALGEDNPLFLLSSLPFITPSVSRARMLYEAAQPLYEKAFAERRQKLLYVTPWPPTGIWSANPISDLGGLNALKLRTYDKVSTDVFARLVRDAILMSFADVNARLESGEINAVLSSGDGGAGRKLWKYLRNFSDIQYAIPLSFTAISLQAWNQLDETAHQAIEAAARETTERQWAAVATRAAVNFAWMRANGVMIEERPPRDVMTALRAAAWPSVVDWSGKVGPEGQRVLKEYDSRSAR